MKKNAAVLIGRFQPFHNGHLDVIKDAINQKDINQIIILVGSSNQARTPKNPFTFKERKKTIELVVNDYLINNNNQIKVSVLPLNDYIYDNQKWIAEVQSLVNSEIDKDTNVFLIGNKKDKTSDYLDYFPHFEKFFNGIKKIKTKDQSKKFIGATEIRNKFFDSYKLLKNENQQKVYEHLNKIFNEEYESELLDVHTLRFLTSFIVTQKEIFENLYKEYDFIVNHYQKMMESLPYKNIAFFTGDALVTCAGHVLLIKRKIQPGKGMYALPGGFFDAHKDLSQVDTAIRELLEETNLKPIGYDGKQLKNKKEIQEYLKAHIVKSDDFGDFNRSERWRIVTKTTYIKLNNKELPFVKGGDDAADAFWVPFSEIVKNRDKFFEDHLSIIDTFLNIL